MSLRKWIAPFVAAKMLSEKRLLKRRAAYEKARRKAGRPHVVSYFHQIDDPYSHLMLQAIGQLEQRFNVQITPYLVPQPEDWATPERALLVAYSRLDAERLATKAGLKFKNAGQQPAAAQVQAAGALLAKFIAEDTFVEQAPEVSAALWGDGYLEAPENTEQLEQMLDEGQRERVRLGHYLGGTCHYGQEWYWSIDRLHFLEERLNTLCAKAIYKNPIYSPPATLSQQPPVRQKRPDIDFFLSFRSPYTYIVIERLKRVADTYGVNLNLRFVLPMVMRDLPVPLIKGRYIVSDVAREARRYHIPFGRIADPVGKPVERGYAILHWAIAQGSGYEFALSFMRAVWADGVDVGRDSGMKKVVEAAGLDWDAAHLQLQNDNWREVAQANREALFSLGLWGVPSFKVGTKAIWGQDRLWLVENSLNEPVA